MLIGLLSLPNNTRGVLTEICLFSSLTEASPKVCTDMLPKHRHMTDGQVPLLNGQANSISHSYLTQPQFPEDGY